MAENRSMDTTKEKIIGKTIWVFGLSSNAIVVALGTVLAYVFSYYEKQPFLLTGKVTGGLPSFVMPPFSVTNGTSTTTFPDMISNMGSAVIALSLISVLELMAIVKSFGKGKVVNASQEMMTLGLSNIAGAFIGSIPVSGSFTRTAINSSSSVATPFGGVFTGVLIVMSLRFLTSLFYYIPKTTLAALIITAMVFMIEYHAVIQTWRTKKTDVIPFFASFWVSLFFGLEFGMIIGIGINLAFILYSSARPMITTQWSSSGSFIFPTKQKLSYRIRINVPLSYPINDEDVLIVSPTQNLMFPAAEYIRDTVINACTQKNGNEPVIILGTHIYNIDSSVAKGIQLLMEDMKMRNQKLYLWKWRESAIKTCVGYDSSLHQYFYVDNTFLPLFADSDITEIHNQYATNIERNINTATIP